jgi:predicted DNA-binding transcriptional regulator YafY
VPGGDPAAYVAKSLADAPYRYQARVTLHAPAPQITARGGELWGTLEAKGKASCEYRTSDDSLDWLATRIGMLGVDFDVHEPPELAERCALLAERFRRAGAR